MNSLYQPMPPSTAGGIGARWSTFIFLIVIFFAANHDVRYSANYEQIQSLSAEELITQENQGTLARQVALVLLGAFALVNLVFVRRPLLPMARKSARFLSLFILLAFTSVVWAGDKNLTFRRATEFFILCFAAFVVARRYKVPDLLQLAFAGTLLYLLIGLICEIALRKFVPLDEGYRFCGTLHPNHQGWNCAVLLLSSIGLARGYKRWRSFFILISLIALTFLILTKSRTSLACALMALAVYWSLVWTRNRKMAVVYSAVTAFCVFLLLAGHSAFADLQNAVLLGRIDSNPATLTDRTLIWQASIPFAAKRPLLGYGFNSFWTREHILSVSSVVGWAPPAAHCDYIELLLGVGIVGLALFLVVLVLSLARFLKAHRDGASFSNASAFAIIVFYCLTMTTEVIGFSTSLPTFIVYTLFFAIPLRHLSPQPAIHKRTGSLFFRKFSPQFIHFQPCDFRIRASQRRSG